MNELAQYIDESYKWSKWVFRDSPPLWRNLEFLGWSRKTLQKNNGYDMFMSFKSGFEFLYANAEENVKVIEMLNKKAKEDFSIFEHNSNRVRETCKNYLAFCSKYKELPQNLSNEELAEIFEEYVYQNNIMTAYRPLYTLLDNILAGLLNEELKAVGSPEFLYEWIEPIKPLPFVEERDSIINIKSAKEQGEDIELLIKEHLEKFAWLGTHHFLGEPLTHSDILAYMKHLKVDVEKLEQKKAENKVKLERIKSLSPKLRQILDTAQSYAYLRTYRIDVAIEGDYIFRSVFNEIANRMGISYDYFLCLIVDEILDFLNGKADIELLKKEIEKRKEYFVTYLVNDEEIYTFSGNEERLESLYENLPKKNRIVKGLVAQKGRVYGKVKIVNSKEDIDKVEPGDIIVSNMTCPEMMVGIVKCAGIITNEGGISSHASLISRELKIPCVLGTKQATKLWQDGEEVILEASGAMGGMSCHAALISKEFGIPCIMGTENATSAFKDGDEIELVAESSDGIAKLRNEKR